MNKKKICIEEELICSNKAGKEAIANKKNR